MAQGSATGVFVHVAHGRFRLQQSQHGHGRHVEWANDGQVNTTPLSLCSAWHAGWLAV